MGESSVGGRPKVTSGNMTGNEGRKMSKAVDGLEGRTKQFVLDAVIPQQSVELCEE